MFSIMEYVTGTVERHWRAHTRRPPDAPGAPLFAGRSIMLIDEAWHLVSRPETGAYANTLARRARHLGLNLIVMSQQLSDFDTEHGVALLGNSSQQLLLAQNPTEIPFIRDALQLTDREAAELERLKTVKGRHAQMLWLMLASGGINLGVDFLPGALPFSPAAGPAPDPELQRPSAWLDGLVTNVDRTAQNPNLLWWHRRRPG